MVLDKDSMCMKLKGENCLAVEIFNNLPGSEDTDWGNLRAGRWRLKAQNTKGLAKYFLFSF